MIEGLGSEPGEIQSVPIGFVQKVPGSAGIVARGPEIRNQAAVVVAVEQ